MSIVFKKHFLGIFLVVSSFSLLFALPFIPLSGDKSIKNDFFTRNQGQYMLLFFGFPECHTICPPTLKKMGELYTAYQQQYSDNLLEITFVNLLLTEDEQTVNRYARQFHQDFIAYHPTESQLTELKRQLNVYTYQSQEQPLEHSGYIYLLVHSANQWSIKYIYPDSKRLTVRFLDDIKQLKSV